MFKRFSTRHLLITLGALFALYLISLMFGGTSDRTFRETLSSLDSAAVNQLIITAGGNQAAVKLNKNGSQWQVQLADGTYVPTAADAVEGALGQIRFLEARQLVSRKQEAWSEYEVDSAGTRVQVMEAGEEVLDIIFGKFEYQTAGMTYTRLSGEDETYMVDGFLEPTFNKKADEWRDKTLIKGNRFEWSALTFTYPADTSFQMVKDSANNWILPDGTPLNSTEVNSYLGQIANLNGTSFASGSPSISTPLFQLAIQSVSAGLIEVKVYDDPQRGMILSSSLNPSSYFNAEEGGLIEKIFVGREKFLQGETED